MYSEEYLRDLEMSAHLDRKKEQEQEVMICPVCGREFKKWLWRSDCCGVELALVERSDTE